MATNQEQEQFLNDLLSEFEASNQLLKNKWDAVQNYLSSNKPHWTDTQYFYFEKRILEIDQSVDYMSKQIEGPIRQFLEDKIDYLNKHRQ